MDVLKITENKLAADTIFEAITRAVFFGSKKISMILADGKPWFRGKDVALMLGYADPKATVRNLVKAKNKCKLDLLYGRGGKTPPLPQDSLEYNELNSIYISEPGIYQLINRSKLPVAEAFQDWITDELLPKLREESIQKLIREKEDELKESQLKIARLETKQLRLESFVKNMKKLEKNQIFYVATTRNYAAQNRFEYGGVKDCRELRSRLSTYNTGRAEGDLYYYAKLFKCNNYRLIEERVGCVLKYFKDKPDSRKEMVHLRFNLFSDIVEFICDNSDKEIDYINANCEKFLEDTIELYCIIPDPIQIEDYLELTISRNGKTKRQRVDISGWTDQQIDALIENIINMCVRDTKKITYDVSAQKHSIEVELTWKLLCSYFEPYEGFTKTDWRNKIKQWFGREKPQKLNIKGVRLK